MEQTLDFSFHKGNPLAEEEDIESPKPMPSPPPLPLISDVADDDCNDSNEQNISDTISIQAAAVEVIETISISPAPKSGDNGTHDSASSSEDLVSTTNPPVPKFSSDGSQASIAKPKPRAKVPLERGFTQVDWLRLTKIESDLAGLKGGTNRRLIPMSEIKLHRSEDDAWTVLKGRVYNITRYLKFHPGGSDMLMKGSGKDCTALFNKYHSWVNAEYLLEKCLVGFLDVEH